MAQLTIRLDDQLAEVVRRVAGDEGESMNGWVVKVIRLATDPDHEPTGIERTRERLRRAGILAEPTGPPRPRPDPDVLAKARAEAGRGRPLSDYVREDRDEGP